MDTVTDREEIPRLDENNLIALDETRMMAVGSKVLAVFGAVSAGVLAWIGLGTDQIDEADQAIVLLGAVVVVSACMLSWAIVAAADIRARGMAAAANLALRARANITVAAPGEAGKAAGLWAHIADRESGDEHLVVDSLVKKVGRKDERLFLLARNDEKPVWVTEAEIDHWEVKTSSELETSSES